MYYVIDNLNGGSVPCKSTLYSAEGADNQYVSGNLLLGEFGNANSICPNYEVSLMPELSGSDWSFLTGNMKDIINANADGGIYTFIATASSGSTPSTAGKIHAVDAFGSITTYTVNYNNTYGGATVYALYPFQTNSNYYILYIHTGANNVSPDVGILNVTGSSWTQNDSLYKGLVGSNLNESYLAAISSSRYYQITKSVNNLIYFCTNSSVYSFTPSDNPTASSFELIYTADSGWFIKSICDYKGFLTISLVSDFSGGKISDTKVIFWDGITPITNSKQYLVPTLSQSVLMSNGKDLYLIGKEFLGDSNGFIYQFDGSNFVKIFTHNRLDVMFSNDWCVFKGDVWFKANGFLAYIRDGAIHNMQNGSRMNIVSNLMSPVRNLRDKILYGYNNGSNRRIWEMNSWCSGYFTSTNKRLPAKCKITRVKIFFDETRLDYYDYTQVFFKLYANNTNQSKYISRTITPAMLDDEKSFTINEIIISSSPLIYVQWASVPITKDQMPIKRIEVEYEQVDLI